MTNADSRLIQVAWKAPSQLIERDALRRALPADFQHHVKQTAPGKRCEAIQRVIQPLLTQELVRCHGSALAQGDQWSVIQTRQNQIDHASGHSHALSVRITNSGDGDGDYSRKSSPVGEIIIHDDATVTARGPVWVVEAAAQADLATRGKISSAELVTTFKKMMAQVQGRVYAPRTWFVMPDKIEDLRALQATFKAFGASVRLLDVFVNHGQTASQIAEALMDHVFDLIKGASASVLEKEKQQDEYLDPEGKRTQPLRLSFVQGDYEKLDLEVRDLKRMIQVLGQGVGMLSVPLEEAVGVLGSVRDATAQIVCMDRQTGTVPLSAVEKAQHAQEFIGTTVDPDFGVVQETKPAVVKALAPEREASIDCDF